MVCVGFHASFGYFESSTEPGPPKHPQQLHFAKHSLGYYCFRQLQGALLNGCRGILGCTNLTRSYIVVGKNEDQKKKNMKRNGN